MIDARRYLVSCVILGGALVLLAACATTAVSPGPEVRKDVVYTCDCGPQCQCNAVSTEAGKCACGKPLKWGHVVRVEGNDALVCQCAEGCRCAGLGPNDSTKCACGNPVKRVNLAGTGVHFCNCGGSCTCNTVSHRAEQCKCGMELKKVD